MARKILVGVAVLAGVVLIAAIAFAVLFDVNQFRPALAAQLEARSDAAWKSAT